MLGSNVNLQPEVIRKSLFCVLDILQNPKRNENKITLLGEGNSKPVFAHTFRVTHRSCKIYCPQRKTHMLWDNHFENCISAKGAF